MRTRYVGIAEVHKPKHYQRKGEIPSDAEPGRQTEESSRYPSHILRIYVCIILIQPALELARVHNFKTSPNPEQI